MNKHEYVELKKIFARKANEKDFYIKRFHSGMVWMGAKTCKLKLFRELQRELEKYGYEFGYINPYLVRIDVKKTNHQR